VLVGVVLVVVGELAEAVAVVEGTSNKKLSEPLIGEVADVVQCALSILSRLSIRTGDLGARMALTESFSRALSKKTKKWEAQISAKPNPIADAVKQQAPVVSKRSLADVLPQVQGVTHLPKLSQQEMVTEIRRRHDLAKKAGLAATKQAAKKAIKGPGMYVNVRKNPNGTPGPTGKFKVYDVMHLQNDAVFIKIRNSGGWTLNTTKGSPVFIDFLVGVGQHTPGQKVTLQEFVERWKKLPA
jgi:hypothetical protein